MGISDGLFSSSHELDQYKEFAMTPTLVLLVLTSLTLANAMIIGAFLILEGKGERMATPSKQKTINTHRT
ncbi:MAG: hypothetical protein CTY31_01125 [Hyphomicrobium sp.]|nr:MAG: hypothetical protein CTY31_01125 [Hyphomicrobium sp.]